MEVLTQPCTKKHKKTWNLTFWQNIRNSDIFNLIIRNTNIFNLIRHKELPKKHEIWLFGQIDVRTIKEDHFNYEANDAG